MTVPGSPGPGSEGPLAQEFATVRAGIGEIFAASSKRKRDADAALSEIERRVQDMETALRPFAKQPCGKFSPSWDGPEFVPCGECKTCIARATLSASGTSGAGTDGQHVTLAIWLREKDPS